MIYFKRTVYVQAENTHQNVCVCVCVCVCACARAFKIIHEHNVPKKRDVYIRVFI